MPNVGSTRTARGKWTESVGEVLAYLGIVLAILSWVLADTWPGAEDILRLLGLAGFLGGVVLSIRFTRERILRVEKSVILSWDGTADLGIVSLKIGGA